MANLEFFPEFNGVLLQHLLDVLVNLYVMWGVGVWSKKPKDLAKLRAFDAMYCLAVKGCQCLLEQLLQKDTVTYLIILYDPFT